MAFQDTAGGARQGLSREDARALCDRVLSFAKADYTRVNVTSGISGFTRTAMNRVTTAGDTDNVSVRVTSVFGQRIASIDTNRLDNAPPFMPERARRCNGTRSFAAISAIVRSSTGTSRGESART